MKTEQEILQAHKQTIETFTGKECAITLISSEEKALRSLSIEFILQKINHLSFICVESTARDQNTCTFRKIFCLLATEAGHSLKKIGAKMTTTDHPKGRNHTTILDNVKAAKVQLKHDNEFLHLYTKIKKEIIPK